MGLRLDFPGDFVHIPHNLPQPLQVGLVQIRHRCAVLGSAGAGSENCQDILPGDGITAVIGGDRKAVVGVVVLDLFQPVLVFAVELGDGVGQAHAVPGGFHRKEDAESRADHQRNHADDHNDQHRDGSACRNGQYQCVGSRPQSFEARHDGIRRLFRRRADHLCGLLGTLHSFGGSGLCK